MSRYRRTCCSNVHIDADCALDQKMYAKALGRISPPMNKKPRRPNDPSLPKHQGITKERYEEHEGIDSARFHTFVRLVGPYHRTSLEMSNFTLTRRQQQR